MRYLVISKDLRRLASAVSFVSMLSYREPRTAFVTSFSALALFRKADLPKAFPPRLYVKLRAAGALDL
jgi:hypothetical protein